MRWARPIVAGRESPYCEGGDHFWARAICLGLSMEAVTRFYGLRRGSAWGRRRDGTTKGEVDVYERVWGVCDRVRQEVVHD